MTTPSRTGTPSQANASAGNGSTSVTVPADANCVVAFWSHWDDNAGSTISSLTINSVAFSIASQIAEGTPANAPGVGVARLINPATGSQTFAWTWSGGAARTQGGKIVLVYVKDANTSDPVRAAATDTDINANNVTVNLATETTDLLLAMAMSADLVNPVLDGTVFINDAVLNNQTTDVSEVTPSASSTTITMTGEQFSCMAAISLKESGLSSAYATAWLRA